MRKQFLAIIGLFLAALGTPASIAAQEQWVATVAIEPRSNVSVPLQLQVQGSENVHTLTGMGVRTKTFLKVKVYAFGLYVDSAGAASTMSGWAGRSHRDLQNDDSFYEALLEGNFSMTLRLVMTRNVGGDDMAEAFEDALAPRIRHANETLGMPPGEEALARFRSFFSLEELVSGAELIFTWGSGGQLITPIAGESSGAIDSPALCWALFDVYLGDDPVSGSGKKSVIERFPAILSAG